MSEECHLIVREGYETGKRIAVPLAGARLGRSSKNDIVVSDPLLSRHHCRLYFKPGDGLYVTDLASANGTMVNGNPIQDRQVVPGDRIRVGDTVLEVVNDEVCVPPSVSMPSDAGPIVDLGLKKAPESPVPAVRRSIGKLPLTVVAVLVAIIAIAAWVPKILKKAAAPLPEPALRPPPPEDLTLGVEYEKVQATPQNIFRYCMRITPDRMLSIQIDDIANDRHVRKEKRVDAAVLEDVARAVKNTGFLALSSDYSGIKPDVVEQFDLSLTIGCRAQRVKVFNRVEPEEFQKTRETIEEFGKNELGIHAIQFSPDKLREMAQEAFLLARKLYDEREIKYSNLAMCVRRFDEAEWYLETVEPKPDYYAEIIQRRNDARRDLDERYNDQKFRAERAIKLRDWQEASAALQAICELVPDRADPRNEEARKQLLDVQRRMDVR
jgi:hypothetical protein